MISNNTSVALLSPPITPPMSMSGGRGYDKTAKYQQLRPVTTTTGPEYTTMDHFQPVIPSLDVDLSRDQASHRSAPSSGFVGADHTSSEGQRAALDTGTLSSASMDRERSQSDGHVHQEDPIGTSATHDPVPVMSYSPLVSPKTIPSALGACRKESNYILHPALEEVELEDEPVEETTTLTVEELRRQKRKMKRFRLTHQQTRFLMSEFARQAHPDAAHRERLAREIPGLSPRQVQVWFQNRRAKLKRLTVDDQERMMSSRVLPDNFVLTQTLHSPFGSIDSLATMNSSSNIMNSDAESNSSRPANSSAAQTSHSNSHVTPTTMRHPLAAISGPPPFAMSDLFSMETPARDDHFAFPNVKADSPPHRTIETAPISPPISLSGQLQSPQGQPKDGLVGNYSTLSPPSFRNEIASLMIGGLTGNNAVLQGFNPVQGPPNVALLQSSRAAHNNLRVAYSGYSAPYESNIRYTSGYMGQTRSSNLGIQVSNRTNSAPNPSAGLPQSTSATVPNYHLIGQDILQPLHDPRLGEPSQMNYWKG